MKTINRSLLLAAILGLALGAAAAEEMRGEAVRELTLINIKYQGKIVWLPSPLIAKKGEKVRLTLINNVPDDPNVHGFSIPEFNVKADVLRETPSTVEFTASKSGLFDMNCHLHPAHLHGQLLVLEK